MNNILYLVYNSESEMFLYVDVKELYKVSWEMIQNDIDDQFLFESIKQVEAIFKGIVDPNSYGDTFFRRNVKTNVKPVMHNCLIVPYDTDSNDIKFSEAWYPDSLKRDYVLDITW